MPEIVASVNDFGLSPCFDLRRAIERHSVPIAESAVGESNLSERAKTLS